MVKVAFPNKCMPQLRTVKKLDGLVSGLENCYDQMAELQAEGDTTGFSEELLG